jgi:hypothetical protein
MANFAYKLILPFRAGMNYGKTIEFTNKKT